MRSHKSYSDVNSPALSRGIADGFCGVFTHVLDGGQTEANGFAQLA